MDRSKTYKSYHRLQFFKLVYKYVNFTKSISELELLDVITKASKEVFVKKFPFNYNLYKETKKFSKAFLKYTPLGNVIKHNWEAENFYKSPSENTLSSPQKVVVDSLVINESVFSAIPCDSICDRSEISAQSVISFTVSNTPVLHLFDGNTPLTGQAAFDTRFVLYSRLFQFVVKSFGTLKIIIEKRDFDALQAAFFYLFRLSEVEYHIKYGSIESSDVEYVINFTNNDIDKNTVRYYL